MRGVANAAKALGSGRERVNPMKYLRDDEDPATLYVLASKGGAPSNPDWYRNMTAAGKTTIEVGTETFDVTVFEPSKPRRRAVRK